MGDNKKVVKIFTLEQQFPCGPKASCCGPVGQSEQEVIALKNAILALGLDVEVYDIKRMNEAENDAQVFKLFRTFGPGVVPVIVIEDEVVHMGQSKIDEIISKMRKIGNKYGGS